MHNDRLSSDLQDQIQIHLQNNILKITGALTAQKSLNVLSKDSFKSTISNHSGLQGIVFNIKEKIDENFNEKPRFDDFNAIGSIFIAFQTKIDKHESVTYWMSARCDKIHSIFIDDDPTEEVAGFFQEFLTEELKKGRSGIQQQFQMKTKLRLQNISDGNSKNLLNIAVAQKNPNVVQKLLEHDFDPEKVIDDAWTSYKQSKDDISNEIMLKLLRFNSRLPVDFKYEDASEEVKKFIDFCESLHQNVGKDKFGDKLNVEPSLVHFYNRNNQSLLAYALKNNKLKILNFLNRGITIGCHEDLEDIYEILSTAESRLLRSRHQNNAKEFNKNYLLALRMRSRIGNNDPNAHRRWNLVEEAFLTLDSHAYCSKIIKIAAECQNVKIFFDFKHSSTYYLDPASNIYANGIVYESGTIYIGAKDMLDEKLKFQVFGVVGHELCHLAMLTAFMNRNFDPFPMGESAEKTRFIEVVMDECWNMRSSEPIISNVFHSYDPNVQDSEMIVTIPQMLMHYHENNAKIQELEATFVELFKYSMDIVEPVLDQALPVLKILGDDSKFVNFKMLTEPMKAKILHSKIKFQETETTFFEVIGSDREILDALSSEDIRKILLKNQALEVGEACELNLKYGIIEPNFVDFSSDEGEVESQDEEHSINESMEGSENSDEEALVKIKRFEEVRMQVEESKVMLLAAHAGNGKTTTFKSFTKKLKELNKNFWVSFINLRHQKKIFESIESLGFLDQNSVLLFLNKILCQNPLRNQKLDSKIFSKLFTEGKFILLMDGVDEICPKYSQLFIEVLNVLTKTLTKNQLWVSTRPHYAEKLSQVLGVQATKFAPYDEAGIKAFVKTILKTYRSDNEKRHALIYFYITEYFFPKLNCKYKNNPLIIQLLTELYIESGFKFDLFKNVYGIFESIVDKQKNLLGEKVSTDDQDKISRFTVWDIHHILALIVIINNYFEAELGFKLEELSLMRRWKKEKKNWTCDMIQRYGFVSVDLDDGDETTDFVHRSFAEFFVAQFLINFLFDDHSGTSDQELEKIFKLFDLIVLGDEDSFNIVSEFVLDYAHAKGKNQEVDEKIVKLMTRNISAIHEGLKSVKNRKFRLIFEAYALILKSADSYEGIPAIDDENSITNDTILNKLWGTANGTDVLLDYLFVFLDSDFEKALDILESCFGLNWHEKFNKSGQKLIKDEELDDSMQEAVTDWQYEKNLIKFSNLIMKNSSLDDKKRVSEHLDLHHVKNNFVGCKIIDEIFQALDGHSFAYKVLFELNFWTISAETFDFAFEKVEAALEYNREAVRSYLFKSTKDHYTLILQIYRTYDQKVFQKIIEKYEKYTNSWSELQNIFLTCSIYDFLAKSNSSYYEDYKKFIQNVFGRDTEAIAAKVENYLSDREDASFYELNFNNFNDFLLYIFTNDQKRVEKVLKKIKIQP